jgi:hypothetical protein
MSQAWKALIAYVCGERGVRTGAEGGPVTVTREAARGEGQEERKMGDRN